ncbi:hypothetical protein D1BOALGB6SA_1675 [Olavius sp. associated proteobacterium Delta 1]|nr:hypothetical protein D1BOALGB6SA_1675 [Olavius sp. associated proteobacterium Delta 1]
MDTVFKAGTVQKRPFHTEGDPATGTNVNVGVIRGAERPDTGWHGASGWRGAQ